MKTALVKYIIALLATQPLEYTQEAHQLFSSVAEGYIIGADSYPHITLCQFYADEETIELIKQDLKNITIFPQPRFTGISFIKDLNLNFWWAELSVARAPEFIKFQEKMVNILKKYNIICINDIGDLYRPHLTLARVNSPLLKDFEGKILKESTFTLGLGRADELGQLIEVIDRAP